MYIQITDRCNMSCAHCCFNCTEEGSDMPIELFEELIHRYVGDHLVLGGGEPTLHKQFIPMIQLCLDTDKDVAVITNGSNYKYFMQLHELTNQYPNLRIGISIDKYHNNLLVDGRILDTLDNYNVIDVTQGYNLFNSGRMKDAERIACLCPDLSVKPNGDVYQCSCEEAPKILNIKENKSYLTDIGCYRSLNRKEYEDE